MAALLEGGGGDTAGLGEAKVLVTPKGCQFPALEKRLQRRSSSGKGMDVRIHRLRTCVSPERAGLPPAPDSVQSTQTPAPVGLQKSTCHPPAQTLWPCRER